jgi:hypothetical protein
MFFKKSELGSMKTLADKMQLRVITYEYLTDVWVFVNQCATLNYDVCFIESDEVGKLIARALRALGAVEVLDLERVLVQQANAWLTVARPRVYVGKYEEEDDEIDLYAYPREMWSKIVRLNPNYAFPIKVEDSAGLPMTHAKPLKDIRKRTVNACLKSAILGLAKDEQDYVFLGSEKESLFQAAMHEQNVHHIVGIETMELFHPTGVRSGKGLVYEAQPLFWMYAYLRARYGDVYVDPGIIDEMLKKEGIDHVITVERGEARVELNYAIDDLHLGTEKLGFFLTQNYMQNTVVVPGYTGPFYVSYQGLRTDVRDDHVREISDWFEDGYDDLTLGWGLDAYLIGKARHGYDPVVRNDLGKSGKILRLKSKYDAVKVEAFRKSIHVKMRWQQADTLARQVYYDPIWGSGYAKKHWIDFGIVDVLKQLKKKGVKDVIMKLPFNARIPVSFVMVKVVGNVRFYRFDTDLAQKCEVSFLDVYATSEHLDKQVYFDECMSWGGSSERILLSAGEYGNYLDMSFSGKVLVGLYTLSNVRNDKAEVLSWMRRMWKRNQVFFNVPYETFLLREIKTVKKDLMYDGDYIDRVYGLEDLRGMNFYSVNGFMSLMEWHGAVVRYGMNPIENDVHVWAMVTNLRDPYPGYQTPWHGHTMRLKSISGDLRRVKKLDARSTYYSRRDYLYWKGYTPFKKEDWKPRLDAKELEIIYVQKHVDAHVSDTMDEEGHYHGISGHLLNYMSYASIFIDDVYHMVKTWKTMYRVAEGLKKPKGVDSYLLEDVYVWHVPSEVVDTIGYAVSEYSPFRKVLNDEVVFGIKHLVTD